MAHRLSSTASQGEKPHPRQRSEHGCEQQRDSGLLNGVVGCRTIERSSELPDDGRVEHRQHEADGEAPAEVVCGSCRFHRLSGGEGARVGHDGSFLSWHEVRVGVHGVRTVLSWTRVCHGKQCAVFAVWVIQGLFGGCGRRVQKQNFCWRAIATVVEVGALTICTRLAPGRIV
jgi:hypothetical protein